MLLGDADLDALADAYAEDGRLRVEGAVASDEAQRLVTAAEGVSRYDLMVSLQGRFAALSPERLAAIPDEMRRRLQADLKADAAKGQGFVYDGLRLGEGAGPEALEALHVALNGEAVLGRIARMTGERVTRANAQLTRYRPGHYLTRHRDDPEGESRKLAYVLSLTRAWHPDQGGLLMFYTDEGTPRDAWVPGFGTLSLFGVRHVHAVTVVAPFAPAPRLSVTGWFSA